MISHDKLIRIKELLPTVQSVLVLLGPKPSLDQTASALALAEGFQSLGKEVELASPNELHQSLTILPGSDIIKQKLGSKNLSVSFEYNELAVDKVSYHINENNDRFYLVIKPQKGQKPLDASQVSFDYTGAEADLVFLVGVHNFEALEHLYNGYEQLYDQATLITVNSFEPEIGQIKIDVSGSSSMSEAMVGFFKGLEIDINTQMATNLLAGIEKVTQSFQSMTTSADTFEAVAMLMRTGARRLRQSPPKLQQPQPRQFDQRRLEQSPEQPRQSHQPQPVKQYQQPASQTQQVLADSQSEKTDGDTTVFGSALKKKINQKKKRNKNKPGGLDYQPGGFDGSRN